MFRRLILENWTSIFTLAAFITALTVYLTVCLRALRMRRGELDRFAALPLFDQGEDRRHE
jgi:hypothetical protein